MIGTGWGTVVGLAYAASKECAHPLRMVNRAFEDFPDGIAASAIPGFIDQRADELQKKARSGSLDQERALWLVYSEDLRRMARLAEKMEIHLRATEADLREMFVQTSRIFAELGVDPGGARLTIVDQFPHPYEHVDFWAMSFDAADHQMFGIDVGVALKRSYLMPLYSPFLAAHELVHAAIGKVITHRLARGLEDGLADLFGSLHVGSQVLDPEVCSNMLLRSRLLYGDEQIWDTYADSLQLALELVRRDGWEAAVNVLRRGASSGREAIRASEARILTSGGARMQAGNVPDVVANFAERFLSFPRHLVVSPLAFVLARSIRVGDDIPKTLEAADIEPTAGREALTELQNRVYLVLLDGDKIASDETKMQLESDTLRYEP